MAEPTHATPPSVRAVENSPKDRLDSWTEIAAYLNRDVTTVQRRQFDSFPRLVAE